MPIPGWSFRLSGLEKLPVIKWIAKSVSFEHSYSGKESRSWQFENIIREEMNILNFATFIKDYKEFERTARINRNFSPLVGMNMTLKKNISTNRRTNTKEIRTHRTIDNII